MTSTHSAGPNISETHDSQRGAMTRRGLLAATGAAGLLAAMPLNANAATRPEGVGVPADVSLPSDVIAFRGTYQSGITLPRQTDTVVAAFDVTTKTLAGFRALLTRWTLVADALTSGNAVPDLPIFGNSPADPGETWGFSPHRLTLTLGIGPGPFTGARGTTFKLNGKKPASLAALPKFQGDAIRPEFSHGDFVIQACADNAAVAMHAIRQLQRAATGTAKLRWLQAGSAPATPDGSTGRNLFGFKDGTATIKANEVDDQQKFVWVQPGDGPAWHVNGTYLVFRRIHMELQAWDAAVIDLQEASIGRSKDTGAPLSGGDENTPVDLNKKSGSGRRLVPVTSHVAASHPDNNHGVRMLRRGYGYQNGVLPDGNYDAGLLFMAFVRDPKKHFIPMQTRLSQIDNLTRWSHAIGSGVYAVLPGLADGRTWADVLLG